MPCGKNKPKKAQGPFTFKDLRLGSWFWRNQRAKVPKQSPVVKINPGRPNVHFPSKPWGWVHELGAIKGQNSLSKTPAVKINSGRLKVHLPSKPWGWVYDLGVIKGQKSLSKTPAGDQRAKLPKQNTCGKNKPRKSQGPSTFELWSRVNGLGAITGQKSLSKMPCGKNKPKKAQGPFTFKDLRLRSWPGRNQIANVPKQSPAVKINSGRPNIHFPSKPWGWVYEHCAIKGQKAKVLKQNPCGKNKPRKSQGPSTFELWSRVNGLGAITGQKSLSKMPCSKNKPKKAQGPFTFKDLRLRSWSWHNQTAKVRKQSPAVKINPGRPNVHFPSKPWGWVHEHGAIKGKMSLSKTPAVKINPGRLKVHLPSKPWGWVYDLGAIKGQRSLSKTPAVKINLGSPKVHQPSSSGAELMALAQSQGKSP
ncbi:hypothetical protein ACOSQ3_032669 [Xanthoceras sorbifolium]